MLRHADGTQTRSAATEADDASRSSKPGRRAWCLALLAVLAAEAGESLRLARGTSLSGAERRVLAAGHAEITRWLAGAPGQLFEPHTAGTAAGYPVMALVAYDLGGAAAVRAVSLACALAVTATVWQVAMRLGGARAALVAAALVAALAVQLRLGSGVSALSAGLCLVLVALWAASRPGRRPDQIRWLVVAACALVLGNMVAYASAAADPVVIAVAALTAWPSPGGKHAIMRGLSLLSLIVTATVLLQTADGSYGSALVHAVTGALTVRPPVPLAPPEARAILALAAGLTGVIGWAAPKLGARQQALLVALLPGGLLVPLALTGVLAGPGAELLAAVGAALTAVAVGVCADAVLTRPRPQPRRAQARPAWPDLIAPQRRAGQPAFPPA